jgi:hypothetical protein
MKIMKRYLILIITFLLSFTLKAQVPNYVPSNGLLGWWPFSGNANDESGNNNHASVFGATLDNDRFGNTNSSYIFQNNSDNINKQNFPINSQNFTISAWVKLNTAYSYSTFNILKIGASDNTSNGGISLKFDQNDSFYGSGMYKVYGSINSSTTGSTIHSNSLNFNFVSNWHHYILRKNNALIEIYIDNQLVSSSNIFSTIDYTNNWLRIGDRSNINNNLIGIRTLDDIGIWDRALTQTEITDLYTGVLSSESFTNTSSFQLYPNPANDYMQFKSSDMVDKISIYNALGQLVQENKINSLEGAISIEHLAQGSYFVKVNNQNTSYTLLKK